MLPLSHLTQLPTLAHILEAVARSNRDDVALTDETGQLSYGELEQDATRLAGSLFAAGVCKGDRVILLLPAGLDFARAFWAVQRLGAVPCALNPYAPTLSSLRRARSARPRLILFDPKSIPDFEPHSVEIPSISFDDLSAMNGDVPPLAGGREDAAWLQATSGTSGEPRLAMILQRNVIDVVRGMFELHTEGMHAIHVAWVPPWHDLGLVRFMIGPIFIGSTCHIVPPSIHTIPKWLETIARTRGTVTGAPDFAYRIAAHLVDPGLDLSSLRYALTGGEPIRMSTIRMFEQRFGLPGVIHAGYGLAEATLGAAFQRFGEPLVIDDRDHVSCGRAAPGLEIRIDGSNGEPGEILLRGPGIFAGYFEAPEATAEVLRDGWLHTGDIGRLDDQGRLYVLGRRKAMLKRGGAVLAPRELEDAAMRVNSVKLAVAVALAPKDENSTEGIVVAIELIGRAASPEDVADAVANAVREEIGFAPDRVMVLTSRSIPLTWNGKIRHDVLRKEIADGTLEARGAVIVGGK